MHDENFYFRKFQYILMLIRLYFYFADILDAGLVMVYFYTVAGLILLEWNM